MSCEKGSRIPDFFDGKGGVLRTVHPIKRERPSVDCNGNLIDHKLVDVDIIPRSPIVDVNNMPDDVARRVINSSNEPIKAGRIDSDLGVF